jgi:hypothetical protein
MLQENSLGFADVLLRDGRLIVDSFLQHVGGERTLKMIMHSQGSNMILGECELRQSTSAAAACRSGSFRARDSLCFVDCLL